MSETQKTHFADDETLAHIAKLEHELSDCRKECEEQARLNGMGSQREARLMAELAEARRGIAALTAQPQQEPVAEKYSEFITRLSELCESAEFWENLPYQTRLYYGPGAGDFVQRGILRGFVEAITRAAEQVNAEQTHVRVPGKPPMQPIQYDDHGVIRFKQNKIVRYLLDKGPFDMNHLAMQGFDADDQSQFAQLIGYSVSGFGDLSYADPKIVEEADAKATMLRAATGKESE